MSLGTKLTNNRNASLSQVLRIVGTFPLVAAILQHIVGLGLFKITHFRLKKLNLSQRICLYTLDTLAMLSVLTFSDLNNLLYNKCYNHKEK
jgi:hypothetical protein